MAHSEKFQLLRKKGYFIQCLFRGAYQDKGKHRDGKCQRDLVCKHTENIQLKSMYWSAMSTEVAQNQQLLQEYKE